MRHTHRSDRGFTLMELIMVLWIMFLCSLFFRGFLVPDEERSAVLIS